MKWKIVLFNSNPYFGGVWGSSGLTPCSAAQLFNHFTSDHLMKYPVSYFGLGSGLLFFFFSLQINIFLL